ncbi:MAG: DUF4394 domain-containing protein [Isosphaeraceae bacterium]
MASTLSVAQSGNSFGVDFTPVPDRLRFVSDTGNNYRINVDTGAVTVDGTINPSGINVVGSAYLNPFNGTTTTTLYGIALASAAGGTSDRLVIQNPPNNGTIVDVGPLTGVPFALSNLVGFDISRTNTAYAVFTPNSGTSSTLFQINLATGAATSLGTVGGGSALVGLAAPVPEPASVALVGIGLAGGLVMLARRKRASASELSRSGWTGPDRTRLLTNLFVEGPAGRGQRYNPRVVLRLWEVCVGCENLGAGPVAAGRREPQGCRYFS